MREELTLRDESGGEYQISRRADGTCVVGSATLRVTPGPADSMVVEGATPRLVWTVAAGTVRWVFAGGEVYAFDVVPRRPRSRQTASEQGPVVAPMPALVRSVAVGAGDRVRRGETLVVLEAMKMELPVRAGADGLVARVSCHEGDMVQAGQELVRLE